MIQLKYPKTRFHRLRSAKWSNDLFSETRISASDLIQPFFITEGTDIKQPISTLPGIYIYSIDNLIKEAKKCQELGINAILIFPLIPKEKKTDDAKEAYNSNNLVCRSIKELKKQNLKIGIIADVALDPYTLNGHDGITDKEGNILNDETVEILCKQSLALAEAGCDVIAPSDMMDGRVEKIRDTLEEKKYYNTKIISYSAKYASNFYNPFRDAVGSKNCLQNTSKETYQMNYRNSKESIYEIGLDISEGADAVIIKPGMPYLDIIAQASNIFHIPIIGYQVSGEYAMLRIASEKQIFNYSQTIIESLISFKRAGANSIITYAASEVIIKGLL